MGIVGMMGVMGWQGLEARATDLILPHSGCFESIRANTKAANSLLEHAEQSLLPFISFLAESTCRQHSSTSYLPGSAPALTTNWHSMRSIRSVATLLRIGEICV